MKELSMNLPAVQKLVSAHACVYTSVYMVISPSICTPIHPHIHPSSH